MGRHSSEDSENSRSRRKRRSRSRSYDRSESRERPSHRKSKRRQRSPSDRDRRRRSHSSSYERSHLRSKNRRSRSRSTERSHSSHSRTVDYKHKRKSSRRSRSRSRSISHSKQAGGSKSLKSKRKTQSSSREHSYSSDSDDSNSKSLSRKPASLKRQPSSDSLEHLSYAEKAEAKLQMALKAAAAADELLKSQGLLAANGGRKLESLEDQQKRANAIEEIDSEDFIQTAFRSSRSEIPMPKGSAADASHAGAMFGVSASSALLNSKKSVVAAQRAFAVDEDSTMHPNLFVSSEEKMDRWKRKLAEMREKKLLETRGKIP